MTSVLSQCCGILTVCFSLTVLIRYHNDLFVLSRFALDDIGSGSHVHLSLWQNGENVFMASDSSSKHGMSSVGEKFMAGVLHHLSSILAFTAPVPNRLL